MEKKLYYKIDNGDTPIICTLDDVKNLIDAEASGYNEITNIDDKPSWYVTLVFLTDEEFANLPEA